MPDAEIDILAVVDGVVYLCEVKSSARMFDKEKFVGVANRVRPNVALLAVMADPSTSLRSEFDIATKELAEAGIRAELLVPRSGDIDGSPTLPTGSSFAILG